MAAAMAAATAAGTVTDTKGMVAMAVESHLAVEYHLHRMWALRLVRRAAP